jgi:short-subunit dehydrogenase
MQLRGRSLWLIGASSGIGAALAPALAAEGCLLAISARREDELQKVADDAALRGPRPLVKPLDVRDLDAMRRTYAELKEVWGRVEVLFYNAGTWSQARVEDFDTESAVNQVDVNLSGMMRAVGTILPDLIANRSGEIIGTASVAGYAGMPTAAAYTSTKAAENAFLQSIRMDLKRYGVGVTTVNPGFVKTPLTDRNKFWMPFMISPEESARIIVKGLLDGETEIHFPKRLSWYLKILTALPRPVYESLAARTMGAR